MHGKINFSTKYRRLNLFREDTLQSQLNDWSSLLHISLGSKLNYLDSRPKSLQLISYPVGLPKSQLAGTRTDTNGKNGHQE